MSGVYCALVHHPVRDREGAEVATSVTNVDVHDIARTARTYGLRGYFVVSPIEAQHPVVRRIIEHWCEGAGKRRFPERTEAIALVQVCRSIDEAIGAIEAEEGSRPRVLATSARSEVGHTPVSYRDELGRLRRSTEPTLILFGTGHGLAQSVLDQVDATLAPIQGGTSYNHLSVRAAAAVVLDRLLGGENGRN